MWKLFGILLCCYTTLVVSAASKSCTITLPDDVKGFSPVILTKTTNKQDYKLFKPTGQVTNLRHNTKLLLACTGLRNTIESVNADTLELQCSSGSFVDSNKNAYVLSDLVCKSIPSPSMEMTSEACSNDDAYIFNTGFTINKQFYGPVFKICYNNVTEQTIYTHNTINGAAIKYKVIESTRRAFSAEGMKLTTTKTNSFYAQKNQIKRFENWFGSNQNYIVNDGLTYLARGHLTPDADFVFAYEQLSTYYYANVAPEYQVVNAGNWLRVEEIGRQVASAYGDDIESFNGVKGCVKFQNNKGKLFDIHLDDANKMEVPKYYYKVLVHKATDSAIAFVTVNDPFIVNGPAEEFCTNVCEKAGLSHYNFPVEPKGYTFCCSLDEFKLTVDSLPAEVQGSKLLTSK